MARRLQTPPGRQVRIVERIKPPNCHDNSRFYMCGGPSCLGVLGPSILESDSVASGVRPAASGKPIVIVKVDLTPRPKLSDTDMVGPNARDLARDRTSVFQRFIRAAIVQSNRLRTWRTVTACGLIAWLAVTLAGCSQMVYRLAADKEVKYLVEQKSNDPRWDFPQLHDRHGPAQPVLRSDRSRRPADAVRRSGRAPATCTAWRARRDIPAGT